ncbi:MAG: DapH/DapD/GlmU-related protein [Chloroflexi bacterium]|nr:DapH/DapD/GlmU-related protein [Chloroflexota bacterium]
MWHKDSLWASRESNLNHAEDDVWVGAGAIITDGVRVGRGAVIAAGTVVTQNVPSHTVAGGVPARVLKEIRSGFLTFCRKAIYNCVCLIPTVPDYDYCFSGTWAGRLRRWLHKQPGYPK